MIESRKLLSSAIMFLTRRTRNDQAEHLTFHRPCAQVDDVSTSFISIQYSIHSAFSSMRSGLDAQPDFFTASFFLTFGPKNKKRPTEPFGFLTIGIFHSLQSDSQMIIIFVQSRTPAHLRHLPPGTSTSESDQRSSRGGSLLPRA